MTTATGMIASLPLPTGLTFNYAKEWATEELGAFGADNTVGAITTAVADMVKDTAAAKAGSHSLNKAINNREKVLFKNLPYRQVTFNWILTARSQDEFEKYVDFIDDMKIRSAPGQSGGGAFWDYPETFDLEITSDGGTTIFLTPSMACTDIVIDWTPHGYWSQNANGNPITVGVTMTFTELELATKTNIGDTII